MSRMTRSLTALALVALFGLGAWFRASSLEAMPFPDADEAWHGVQAVRMAAGRAFAVRTPTGNPINPFLTPLDVPLVLAFPPSWGLLRAPAVAFGLLAVAMTYVLGARVLDRTTALIAAGLLSSLPAAIIFSRIGFDSCQIPLATMVALYFAFRAHRGGLILAVVAGILVHPTTIFLLPALLAVYLVKAVEGAAGDRRRAWRLAIEAVVAPTAAALAFGCWIMQRTAARKSAAAFLKVHDWPEFATLYGRLMLALGTCRSTPRALRIHDAAFWGLVLGLLALGLFPLVRSRRWDRVALIGGLIASAVGFHVVTGKGVIWPEWVSLLRYGMFLVVPSCLALACLARGLLVEPVDGPRAAIRHLQHAGLLAVGFACLYSTKTQWFDAFAGTGESIWTFKTDNVDPFRVAVATLTADIDGRGPGAARAVVMAADYWDNNPILFLAHRRRDLQVLNYADLIFQQEQIPYAERARRLRERMEAGAYAVSYAGKASELTFLVNSLYPAERLRSWNGCLTIQRLKTPAELAAGKSASVAAAGAPIRR